MKTHAIISLPEPHKAHCTLHTAHSNNENDWIFTYCYNNHTTAFIIIIVIVIAITYFNCDRAWCTHNKFFFLHIKCEAHIRTSYKTCDVNIVWVVRVPFKPIYCNVVCSVCVDVCLAARKRMFLCECVRLACTQWCSSLYLFFVLFSVSSQAIIVFFIVC